MQFFSTLALSVLVLRSTVVASPIVERTVVSERDTIAQRDVTEFFTVISDLVSKLNGGLPTLSTSISSSCSSAKGFTVGTTKGKAVIQTAQTLIAKKIDLILALLAAQTSTLKSQISAFGITSTTTSLSCSAEDVAGLVTGLQLAGSIIATIKAEVLKTILEVAALKAIFDPKIAAIEAAILAIFKPLLTSGLAVIASAKVDVTSLISAVSAFKLIVGDISAVAAAATCTSVVKTGTAAY